MARLRFAESLRRWRNFRRLSQLELALVAEVSQRHISWLETGRSQPSRHMVIMLAEALDIPLRERNALLEAAGLASEYRESQPDDPAMAPIISALSTVLQHHAPFPAMVIDRKWNIRFSNTAADLLIDLVAQNVPDNETGTELPNLAWITFHREGLRQYILNWEQVASQLIRRLEREAAGSGSPASRALLEQYIRMADVPARAIPEMDTALLPVLPLEMEISGQRMNLFSVIATFGTPQDITTDELRIETFYPADEVTRDFFEQLSHSNQNE